MQKEEQNPYIDTRGIFDCMKRVKTILTLNLKPDKLIWSFVLILTYIHVFIKTFRFITNVQLMLSQSVTLESTEITSSLQCLYRQLVVWYVLRQIL